MGRWSTIMAAIGGSLGLTIRAGWLARGSSIRNPPLLRALFRKSCQVLVELDEARRIVSVTVTLDAGLDLIHDGRIHG